ncbi:alpha/beta hydrolase fold protein [Xylanimonas cellulosilytica DSM 15894]|uniref:Alpha/beta hydrolase fold protein n=1 Tax=Xylanimonas cellulosilytica (strain DSM 15894 / JCM 12276 / CECT 5975 / KCTC 9989 / LMG 20990 / NBRC 107835 / XIL07) TaxID=446471 RepID=D1BW96_XYLCX|nr:alpha/beta hydrolase [Xylanimonas cellulosilytica]ACZ31441.1 alpha/beta hydrolase fold protein [Xylanimonas cellulosilytica DSM 15894]
MTPLPKLAMHELHDGGGVPIVLVHAFPLDHRVWGPAAELLPAGVRAIAVDLPGQGYSEFGNIPPRIDLVADALHQTLQGAGIANAVVAGVSMGGYVALALTERHPGFVSGLALVDTKATADTPEVRANRLRIAREMEMGQSLEPVLALPSQLLGETSLKQRRHLLPTLDAWVHAQAPRGLAWALRMMAGRPDRTHVVKEFSGPIAVVVGAEDKVTPLDDAEHMVHAAQNGALTVVPGAGHLAALEEPAAVAAALALLHRAAVQRRRR